MSGSLTDIQNLRLADFQKAFDTAEPRQKLTILSDVLYFIVSAMRENLIDEEVADFGVKKRSGIQD